MRKPAESPKFDKYKYYEASVQNPEGEVEFAEKEYRRIRGKSPKILREDFCGTGLIMCAWAKQDKSHVSWGLDLDPQPIRYGMTHHLSKLDPEAQERVRYVKADVLKGTKVQADMVLALNFSYCIFKERELLRNYFKSVYESLLPGGIFVLDIFGGPDSQTVIEETTNHRGFVYHWDCTSFNPINAHCKFAIHFTVKKPKKVFYKNVFRYDWRLWTVPELREILIEAGFKQALAYFEGDDNKGSGNGVFKAREREENCQSWVAYVIGAK